jgi:DNA-binding winged helix-turn-helix (wHTH) protein/Tol biopolymer transport system component
MTDASEVGGIRTGTAESACAYEFAGYRLEPARRAVLGTDGTTVTLTGRAFDTLMYLVEHAGKPVARDELLHAVWGRRVVEDNNLNQAIAAVRRALGEHHVVTLPGRGYQFVTPIRRVPIAASAPASPFFEKPTEPRIEPLVSAPPIANDGVESDRRRSLARTRRAGLGLAAAALMAGGSFAVPDTASAPSSRGLRVTPLLFERDGGEVPHLIGSTVWKPDGTAIAFTASRRDSQGPPEPYVLYLGGSSPMPLTPGFVGGLPKLWTSDGHVWLNTSQGPRATSESAGLLTVPAVGGRPVPLLSLPAGTTNIVAVSADGSALAALRRDEHGVWGVWTGSVAAGALERYEPALAAHKNVVNTPALAFSPDGRKLLLLWNAGATGEQAWLLPYPPERGRPPRRILDGRPRHSGTPQFSWLPDSRHVVISGAERAKPSRLYLADTESDRFVPLTDGLGTAYQLGPIVSPDGDRVVFSEITGTFDVVTMSVRTARVTPVIATNRWEEMPAWGGDGRLVYVAERNGRREIRLRERRGGDRPIVTADDFPPGTTYAFMTPQLSPDGARVMYLRVESDEHGAAGARLWMSSLDGGAPIRLRERAAQQHPGSWSPDGEWYAYRELQSDGSLALKKARTAGTSAPETLAVTRSTSNAVPVWSPDGRWILVDDAGLTLIAADGGAPRSLGIGDAPCAFALEPELLYCLENSSGEGALVARRFDGTADVIGSVPREHWPAVSNTPGVRLSLTPDGEGITYSVGSPRVELLLAEGLSSVPRP